MPNYKLTPEAIDDINQIIEYTLTTWGEEQASIYISHLEQTFSTLCEHPEIGKERNEIRTGVYSFPSKNHIIYFNRKTSFLTILRVLHESMDVSKQI